MKILTFPRAYAIISKTDCHRVIKMHKHSPRIVRSLKIRLRMLIFLEAFMRKSKNPFHALTRFELILWLFGTLVVTASFLMGNDKEPMSLVASLIGITALIFVAKGMVSGQLLIVLFSVFYGFISFDKQYYGEMITYLGMSAPIAVMSVVSWLRHPFESAGEVKVARLTRRACLLLGLSAAIVTVIFYFILGALHNASLAVSTLSVTTSFLAASLTFLRSPYYALAYAANDAVLISLWVSATVSDRASLPMVFCFLMFFINDIYGFISWRRMEKRQSGS